MATTKTRRKKAAVQNVTVTFAKFDTVEPFNVVRSGIPIAEFTPITAADYSPRGGTPLLDATQRMIAHMDEVLAADPGGTHLGLLADESGSMGGQVEAVVGGVNEFVGGMTGVEPDPDAAGKVLVVILTDGFENSSREATTATIEAAIDARKAKGWEFIYMGANQDAWATANASGMAASTSMNYASTPKGTKSAMRAASNLSAGFVGENATYAALASASTGGTIDEETGEVKP